MGEDLFGDDFGRFGFGSKDRLDACAAGFEEDGREVGRRIEFDGWSVGEANESGLSGLEIAERGAGIGSERKAEGFAAKVGAIDEGNGSDPRELIAELIDGGRILCEESEGGERREDERDAHNGSCAKHDIGGEGCGGATMLRTRMRNLWFVAFLTLLPAADWGRFRGPNGSGVGSGTGLPVEFGPGKNVAWKAAVPFGRSSPVVAGDRVFLTASEAGTLLTLAYDLKTGKELWRRGVKPSGLKPIYKANDAASPTPAVDENSVYVFFQDFGLIAYSLAGKERWRAPMGPFTNFYGIGSSPVVANGLVVMLCDQIKGSFVVAVDTATGKVRWRRERPEAVDGWSVPVVYLDQLILVGSARVDSYQLATGEGRWWYPLMSNGAMGSPVIHGDTLVVTASGSDTPWMPSFGATLAKVDKNGDGLISSAEAAGEQDWYEHFGWVDADGNQLLTEKEWETARQFGVGEYGAVAIPLGGKGKLENAAIRWRLKRNLPYVPSALLYEGVFYMVKSGGIVTSVDPATGAILKQGRSTGALGEYHSSPVAGDGKIYAANVEGKMAVLQAGAQWELLRVNDLEDEVFATPAIVEGGLIVRTRGALYRFGGR